MLPTQELATDPPRPQWFLLMVRRSSEAIIARSLQAKGFEVFLPMHIVVREWSDRTKRYSTPIFPCNLGSAREFEKPPIGGDLSVLPFLGSVALGFRP